jgi:hypothetical protein
MELQQGMIGFSSGNTAMQRIIRFFIDSNFSHSFLVMECCGILSALETTETRVCVTPMDRKLIEKNWVELWEVIAPMEDKVNAITPMYYSYSGNYYGYLSYLWFMYRWLCRKFGVEKKNMWGWVSSGVTCSEVTSSYVSKLYPNLLKDIDLNTITPRELRNLMVSNKDKFMCLGWYKQ